MLKRNPSDGSPNGSQLSFTAASSAAGTLNLQVTDHAGNALPGVHAFLVSADTVNEDIAITAATTGLYGDLSGHAAAIIDAKLAVTSINGTFVGTGATEGVTVRVTLMSTGETKEVTITAS